MSEAHFEPEGYLERIRDEVRGYDELQDHVAAATVGVDARRILELGVGTGETSRRVLELHPRARLTGFDSSAEMVERARLTLAPERIEALSVSRLEEPLPTGPFELVFSALAVHHLDAACKRELFGRIAQALAHGGRFVLGDVVVPERPDEAMIELTEGFDLPDRVDDQLVWLEEAGLAPRVVWSRRDLAVVAADRIRRA